MQALPPPTGVLLRHVITLFFKLTLLFSVSEHRGTSDRKRRKKKKDLKIKILIHQLLLVLTVNMHSVLLIRNYRLLQTTLD